MDNQVLNENVASSFTERPVHFNCRGKSIFAIFHPARNNAKKVGVIFLNAGLQYRVGPHRMFVKTARKLSQIGFPSLRMDFSGLGDSEGEIRDPHFDCFDVEETLSAVDFLTQQEKIEKVVLLGLCSGARNAIKTAAMDVRIDSTIVWSLPFYALPNSPTAKRFPQALRRTDAKHHLRHWLKKALNVTLWKNYISHRKGLSSVKNVFRSLIVRGKKGNDSYGNEFFKAFESILFAKRKIFFVYGERDVILNMFEEIFEELPDDKRRCCNYCIIPNGDHTYTSLEAEKIVIEKTAEWLVQQYGLKIKEDQRSLTCPN